MNAYRMTPAETVHTVEVCESIDAPGICRPVVVIDPGDRAQIQRLEKAYDARVVDRSTSPCERVDAMQAALRSLIAPPKPPEPLVGGSQVREADGTVWTRVEGQSSKPWVYGGSDAAYASLNVVEVLR